MPRADTSRIAAKQLKLREKLWPDLDETTLWIRTQKQGFTTIPRTMPLVLRIMDSLSNGRPVGSTYFELWCRARDDCFVTLNRPDEMAFHAGFAGQRGVTTWRGRLRILNEIGFIDVKPGPSGPYSYALFWNPYLVIRRHAEVQTPGLEVATYNALQARAIEIGASDLD